MIPELETDRLFLREVRQDDAPAVFTCWMNDSEVSRYMWWNASDDIADAEKFIRDELDQTDNGKWNRWLVHLKATGELIGTCLIYWNDEDIPPHWDISYNLGRRYWGKGYAPEAVKRVLDHAGAWLGMEECTTCYARENTRSAGVLHRLGFIDEGSMAYECGNGTIVEGVRCTYRTIQEKEMTEVPDRDLQETVEE